MTATPASPPSTSSPAGPRRVLMLTHTGRPAARDVARAFVKALTAHDIVVRLPIGEAADLELRPDDHVPALELAADGDPAGLDCELALVIGGDGTILRAAEVTRVTATPVLGVNLGHVGFLAEAEEDDIDSTIEAIIGRRYTTEERLTLEVRATCEGAELMTTFAVNDASVEKASRERMLEVAIEIDARPLSRFGCDGVVCATPTGSTAYNFSAGGPIVWPGVEALLMVPISAHALFARPLVIAPTSVLTVEVAAHSTGVLWCDGRRTVDLPPGSRVQVTRAAHPVSLVRLHKAPFTDRLVAKFDLPVQGWREASERRRGTDPDA